jgi:predicted dienelactone hydrolase
MRYFAMLDTEKIRPLGECASVDEAYEKEPGSSHWMFDEMTLRAFIAEAQAALGS